MLICEFSSLRLLFVRGQGGPGLVWRNKRRHQPLLPRLNETFIETIPQSRLLAEIRCSADGNSCQMYWDDGEAAAVSSEHRRSSDKRQDTSSGWACVSTLMRGKITDGCFYCSCHTESGFMAHVISRASDPVRGPGQCMRPNTNKSTQMYVLAYFWAVKDVMASLATKWSLCARNIGLTNNVWERSGILKRKELTLPLTVWWQN